jgi:hypothetical protein
MTTLGVLYPGHAAEDDYPTGAGLLDPPAAVEVVHTRVDDNTNTVDDARRTGETARLLDGVHELRARFATLHQRPDAVVWACTAGSFVYGLAGALTPQRGLGSLFRVDGAAGS